MAEAVNGKIPINDVFWPEQVRKHFDEAEIIKLSETITAHGILEPIGVHQEGDRYIGEYGQRRWMAAKRLGMTTIPAVVRDKPLSELQVKEIRLAENMARESLRPVELAVGLEDAMKLGGYSAREMAKRVGLEPSVVSKTLSLLKLSEPIRRQIDAGAISAAHGYQLALEPDLQKREALAAQVASGELSRDALARQIRCGKKSAQTEVATTHSRITARLPGGRSITILGGPTSFDSAIETLKELLARLRTEKTRGRSLPTVLRMLAEESQQASGMAAPLELQHGK
jgi:ParB family chromosome partitioning protein